MLNSTQSFSNSCATSPSFEKDFFHSQETYIHPTAIIGPHVTLAQGVKVGPYCILMGTIFIGENSRLYGHVTIGFPAQDTGTLASQGTISIGSGCHIREFVTIHASKYNEGKTVIGNNCYLMNYAHVGHDVTLEDNVILINNVNIGGHSHIECNVMLMANSAVHQFCRIGAYSALAPFSATRQDLPPFCLFNGQPAGFSGLNSVGLRRGGFSRESVRSLKSVTRWFYQEKKLLENIKTLVAHENSIDTSLKRFLEFIESSKRGVSRRMAREQDEKTQAQEGER